MSKKRYILKSYQTITPPTSGAATIDASEEEILRATEEQKEVKRQQFNVPQSKISMKQIKQWLNQLMSADIQQNEWNRKQSLGKSQQENQIERMETIENHRNFEATRIQVQEILKNSQQASAYSRCIKKMVFAKRQLDGQFPILSNKRKILQLLASQDLLIIEGEAGSGKSTQLPQILSEYYNLLDDPKALAVLVTQPRRLATKACAKRVALQMHEQIGNFIEYVTSANYTEVESARIIFKLDRLALDEISKDPLLSKYSCIVIDEVQQRTIHTDLLLGLVKNILHKRKDFKVIIPSSSMDITNLCEFFQTKAFKIHQATYPTTIKYRDYGRNPDDQYQTINQICKIIDEEILEDNTKMRDQFKGHLLCFCRSIEQINELVKIYRSRLDRDSFLVSALHDKISSVGLEKVLSKSKKCKIIFATRIAETEITVDNIGVIIDPGQDMQQVYDWKYNTYSMKFQEISQSSAQIRARKCGIARSGICFRLYSKQSLENRKTNKTPQIANSSLDSVMLRLKTINVQNVSKFAFITKPEEKHMNSSLNHLHTIGALKGKQHDYHPTKIGQIVVKMPIQPIMGIAIIKSTLFDQLIQQRKCKLQIPPDDYKLLKKGTKNTIIQILSTLLNIPALFLMGKKDMLNSGHNSKQIETSDKDGNVLLLSKLYKKYKEKNCEQKQRALLNSGSQIKLQDNKISRHKTKMTEISPLIKWVIRNKLNIRGFDEAQKLAKQLLFIVKKVNLLDYVAEQEIKSSRDKLQSCTSFKQIILSILATSYFTNLCRISADHLATYRLINQGRPVRTYGISKQQLQGRKQDWVICFDLFTNDSGYLFSQISQHISQDFLKKHLKEQVPFF